MSDIIDDNPLPNQEEFLEYIVEQAYRVRAKDPLHAQLLVIKGESGFPISSNAIISSAIDYRRE